MNKSALIFGSSGQDGQYLSRFLKNKSIRVTGIDRSSGVNLSSTEQIEDLIKASRPGYIFHFAANSTTAHEAWKENQLLIVSGTQSILEAVRKYSPDSRVFISGSGLQFVNNGDPIKETDEFYAGSAYALSRIQSAYAARYYRSIGVKVYLGYFFNHDSPLRSERHINKRIIETARRISLGKEDKLVIGDPTVCKEFGFAGDIVQAVWTLVNQEEAFEAAIGTGISYPISKWIGEVFEIFRLPVEKHLAVDPGFTPEYRNLQSDPSTIFSLGWRPQTTFEELAKMMTGQ